MASDLENKIIKQVEYYFGDINLPRDKFMKEKLKENDGWVTLEVLLTFKRLASLSDDPNVILEALEKAENGLIEISEDKKKIRRNPDLPCPELTDSRKKELMGRTAYAKGFPLDENLTDIMTFLEGHGTVESCHKRSTKDHKFKGSCFIIFKDVETCKKFIEAESIKYKDTELIRKWQEKYFAEKKQEYEDRIKNKKEKMQAKTEQEKKQLDLPKGAIIHFSGIPEGKNLTREEIKEKVNENEGIEVSYIDFNKGDIEGYIRLSKENAAVELVKKVGDEIEVSEVKLKIRALEGEEEENFLSKTAEAVIGMRKKQKMGKGRKRKGNIRDNENKKKKKNND